MVANRLTRRVPAWGAGMLVAVAIFTAAWTAAAQSTADSTVARADGAQREDVLIIGDSLTVASSAALALDLRSIGYEAQIDAKSGRRIGEAVPILQRVQASRGLPERIVIALSTNNHSTPATRLQRDIDDVLTAIGPNHDIVWVNAYLDAQTAPRFVGYETVNRLLEGSAAKHANVTIADWHAYAVRELAAGSLTMLPDGVHYSKPSTPQRAAFVTQALPPCRACSALYRERPVTSTGPTPRS